MSSPTTAFEKSLRSFQTGGLTYGDFLGDLTALLATGSSPLELQEILSRRQAIEPMSDSTYSEVVRMLVDAAGALPAVMTPPVDTAAADAQSTSVVDTAANEAAAVGSTIRSRPRTTARVPAGGAGPQLFAIPSVSTEATDAAALARAAELAAVRSALDAAQNKTREITELARARIAEAAQDNERLRSNSALLQQSLAERDFALATLQRESASSKSSLSAELTAARSALAVERIKTSESSAELASERAASDTERRAHAAALNAVQEKHSQAAQKETEKFAEVARKLAALETERHAQNAALTAVTQTQSQAAQKEAERSAEFASKLAALEIERRAHAAALAAAERKHSQAAQQEIEKSAELSKKLATVEADCTAHVKALTAMQDEHAQAQRSHDVLSSSRDHLEADMQAMARRNSSLTSEVAAARRALDDERNGRASIEAARVAAESALRAAEQQLRTADQQLRAAEHQQSDARQLRDLLAARDGELVALRLQQTEAAGRSDTRDEGSVQLQADLAAARARVDSLEAELKSSQEAGTRLASSLKNREAELGTTGSELAAAKSQSASYLESLQSREWRQGFEHSFDAHVDFATPAVAAQEAAAQRVESTAITEALPPSSVAASAAPTKPGAVRRTVLLALVILALGVVGWLIARHRPAATVAALPPAPIAAGSVLQDCATCPTLTVLPAGRFKQGSVPTDANYSAFEGPQHWVMLTRSFALSTNPITVDQFAPFVAATGRDMQGCDVYDGAWKNLRDGSWKNPGFEQSGTHPVTCVSFDDATAYAQWLSMQTGHTYRLPSASEWEYAARAGGTAAQPWQSVTDACASANVADASAAHRYPGWRVFACDDGFVNTAPVGSFHANAFGLNDMLGNVFQWTQDCWSSNYADAPIDGSARSNGDCRLRELRGGSWFSAPKFVRATYRNQFAADYRTSSVGIRLVRDM